ncbi:MAG: NlpC/P60 family protein [Rhodanobacter sp.]
MIDPVAPAWCVDFVKIPYVDRGRDHVGVDCYGLVVLVNREQFAREVRDYVYASSLDQISVAAIIERHLTIDWGRVETPQPGDLVMLQILGRPWHCAIHVAPGLILHAIDNSASCIDRVDSVRWQRRVLGYYRPVAA